MSFSLQALTMLFSMVVNLPARSCAASRAKGVLCPCDPTINLAEALLWQENVLLRNVVNFSFAKINENL